MMEGDIVLTPVPQADGRLKNRPALYLRQMPPFGDILVCGISTQLHHRVEDFDEVVTGRDADFDRSGLIADSLIRLGFLAVVPQKTLLGNIGSISAERYRRLINHLSDYLRSGIIPERNTG